MHPALHAERPVRPLLRPTRARPTPTSAPRSNGNYGFGDGCFNGTLDATDPADPVCTGGDFDAAAARATTWSASTSPTTRTGNPMYKVTGEEDINIGNGDQIIPQVPPPACAGALHTVDVAGMTARTTYAQLAGDGDQRCPSASTVPASTPVDNADVPRHRRLAVRGHAKPRCDTKLVTVNNGKSVVPMFNVFTDVPLPGPAARPDRRRHQLLRPTPSRRCTARRRACPFVPVGIYDFSNRLVTTVESDFNGFYDVLLPSTNHISCPTPSGVCANMYRFVGNDPGIPGTSTRTTTRATARSPPSSRRCPG